MAVKVRPDENAIAPKDHSTCGILETPQLDSPLDRLCEQFASRRSEFRARPKINRGRNMDFEDRLKQAIERGQQSRSARTKAEQQKTLSAEELRNLHSSARLNLSDHAETLLRKLADHFPGFRFETVVDEDGWGARISRDDVNLGRGIRANQYSRFQILVRPYSEKAKIVEVVAKGAIRNKELLNRSHYQFLAEFDEPRFKEVVDLWVLEFAEQFSSTT